MNTLDRIIWLIFYTASWEWLIARFVMGLIGILFGLKNNRKFMGFALGFLVGPIGWALVLFACDLRLKCPECKGQVIKGATRCKNCGADLRKPTPAPSTVKCPYCNALILAKSLKTGDNTCPKCREVFSVE